MHEPVFQILFLGENPTWLRISQSLVEAPQVALKVIRLQSPADAIRKLAAGRWDALAVDLHAWSFQGLLSVKRVRAEYPAVPIIALMYPSVPDLEEKAKKAGASRCVNLNELTADELQGTVVSILTEKNSEAYLGRGAQMEFGLTGTKGTSFPATKSEIISHALNNLLCVINANADILADQLSGSDPGVHSVAEIKKAARSAADLMRHLK